MKPLPLTEKMKYIQNITREFQEELKENKVYYAMLTVMLDVGEDGTVFESNMPMTLLIGKLEEFKFELLDSRKKV